MVANRRYALGLWAAYYLVVGSIATGIGVVGNLGWLAALDVVDRAQVARERLFDMPADDGQRSSTVPMSALR